jgi:hypothetical protein
LHHSHGAIAGGIGLHSLNVGTPDEHHTLHLTTRLCTVLDYWIAASIYMLRVSSGRKQLEQKLALGICACAEKQTYIVGRAGRARQTTILRGTCAAVAAPRNQTLMTMLTPKALASRMQQARQVRPTRPTTA